MTIDLNELKYISKNEIIRMIEANSLMKDLVIESALIKPIERIIGAKILKQHGIDKIYRFESTLSSKSENILYIITSDPFIVQELINHIKNDYLNNITRNRSVLFYHGRNIVIDYMFETEGVIGDLTIEDLFLNFIPLDTDVLSMEYSIAFKQLFIDKTNLPLPTLANALLHLQSLYGEIPRVYSVGMKSQKLVDIWSHSVRTSLPSYENIESHIGKLIMIDRNVDPITICSSQLTFEGLLSDVYGINSGFAEIGEPKKKQLLNDTDPIFKDIRDLSLTDASLVLQRYVKMVQDKQQKVSEMKEVSEFKEYVQSDMSTVMNQKENLTCFVNSFNDIIEKKKRLRFEDRRVIEENLRSCNYGDDDKKYIEWNIITQQNILDCLKLLCLWNCTKYKNVNAQKKEFEELFIKSYGFEHISTFCNLERSGFFTNYLKECKNDYKNLIDGLEIIPKSETIYNEDISSIFENRYRSLSCKIVENIICDNFPKLESSFIQNGVHSHVFSNKFKPSDHIFDTVAVFYIGGICHSEISSLRMLAKKYNKKIIILTTSVLNGFDIMQMHIDPK